jgi:hypothetical protein
VSRPEAFAPVHDGGERGCDDDVLDGGLYVAISMRMKLSRFRFIILSYRALLDRLQDSSCSNDCRINQVLVLLARWSTLRPTRTHLLDIGDVEVERAGSVKHNLKWRV